MAKIMGITCPNCNKVTLEFIKSNDHWSNDIYQCPFCDSIYCDFIYWKMFSDKFMKEIISGGVIYDKAGGYIFRKSDCNPMLDVRGWNFFQYLENPEGAQNSWGQFVVDAINEKIERINKRIDKI